MIGEHKATNRMSTHKLSLVGLGLLFLSLYFTGPKFVVFPVLKVTPTDIILLIALYVISIYIIVNGKQPRLAIPLVPVFFFILFLLILLADIWRVEWPERNVMLVVALLRNALIVLLVAYWVSMVRSFRCEVLKLLARISICVSAISITMYCAYLTQLSKIKANPALWKPNIWYNLREDGVLSLSGPGRDPNFFGLVNIVGLIAILLLNENAKFWKTGSCVVLVALGLTFSRSVLFLLVTLLFMLSILSAARKNVRCLKVARNRYCKIAFLCLLPAFGVHLDALGGRPIDIFKSRFTKGLQGKFSDRLDLWEIAITAAAKAPIFGKGGRYVQITNARYVHNDYLEVLSSYGLVGLATLAGFLLSATLSALRRAQDALCLAGCTWFLLCLLFMGAFSIFFNPYIYFALGLTWDTGKTHG